MPFIWGTFLILHYWLKKKMGTSWGCWRGGCRLSLDWWGLLEGLFYFCFLSTFFSSMTVLVFKIIWEFYSIKSLLLQRSRNWCSLHPFLLSFVLNVITVWYWGLFCVCLWSKRMFDQLFELSIYYVTICNCKIWNSVVEFPTKIILCCVEQQAN